MQSSELFELYRYLFEKKAFAHLCTLNPDGSPQSTVVWVDWDGEHLRVNTARGRRKERNVRRDPRVALSIADPDDPYRYLEVRGRVVAVREEGADAHIEALAQRYHGHGYHNRSSGEQRVILLIRPEHCSDHKKRR